MDSVGFRNYIKLGGNSGENRRGIGGEKMKDGPGQNTVYPCMKISNNKEKELKKEENH